MIYFKRRFCLCVLAFWRNLFKILLLVLTAAILHVVVSLIENIYTGDYSTTQFPLDNEDFNSNGDLNILNLTTADMKRMKHKMNSTKIDEKDMKYILIWTPNHKPFSKMLTRGRNPFIRHKCEYSNCYLTNNRTLKDISNYSAILFSIGALQNLRDADLPRTRSPAQKYIAASRLPPSRSVYLPPKFDSYFNWTWTYKLNSDILWRNFQVVDKDGNEIGPRIDTEWVESSHNITEEVEDTLFDKTKAVVWLIKNCNFETKFTNYVENLTFHLSELDIKLDIFGQCKFAKKCNRSECTDALVKDYHFYIAFENQYEIDYVTGILLTGMKHFAIPIIYGHELYSRFLPPNSFIDAEKHKPKSMAKEIKKIMEDFELLKSYFQWTNNYEYQKTNSEICNLCTALNDRSKMEQVSVYQDFRMWWYEKVMDMNESQFLLIFEKDEELRDALAKKNYSLVIETLNRKYLTTEDVSVLVYVYDKANASFCTTDDSDLDWNVTITETILVEDD